MCLQEGCGFKSITVVPTVMLFFVGVLYRCGSQNTDDELYSNVEGSPAFEDFLTWLGTKISLEGWDRYTGGLDTRGTVLFS